MPEWWTHFFDEDDYALFLGEPVSPERTRSEAKGIASLVGLQDGNWVLDVGCGTGRHCVAFQEIGIRATELDLSAQMLANALKADSVRPGGPRHFICRGSALSIPFLAGVFDAVTFLYTSFGFCEHEADNTTWLAEMRRVLRPSGQCVIDLANRFREPFTQHTVRHAGSRSLVIDKCLDIERGRVRVRWRVYTGRLCDRDVSLHWRAYTPWELAATMGRAGLVSHHVSMATTTAHRSRRTRQG